ncbi:MAG: MBL fold metallo-hydrolase [Puniceicoccales bacterium]|nr:MBL fold metallo-hydrolase [Puniceicoccales bacterium]
MDESAFTIYFIDVGQADSALVLCDAQSMLIDGGNVADSDLVYTFLKKHGVNHLNYIIGTHAHEDHIGGLAGALNFATVDKAYCPVTNYNSKAFENFKKYLEKQNVSITIPCVGDVISFLDSRKVMTW